MRDYSITAGDGPIEAVLTVSKGKTMRLTLLSPAGTVLSTASGSGTVRIASAEASSGAYTLRVDGATSGSFGLSVSYRTP